MTSQLCVTQRTNHPLRILNILFWWVHITERKPLKADIADLLQKSKYPQNLTHKYLKRKPFPFNPLSDLVNTGLLLVKVTYGADSPGKMSWDSFKQKGAKATQTHELFPYSSKVSWGRDCLLWSSFKSLLNGKVDLHSLGQSGFAMNRVEFIVKVMSLSTSTRRKEKSQALKNTSETFQPTLDKGWKAAMMGAGERKNWTRQQLGRRNRVRSGESCTSHFQQGNPPTQKL